MSIELSMLDKLKARVQLARKIELAQHKAQKSNHDRKWMKETAEVLGVELDSDVAMCALFSALNSRLRLLRYDLKFATTFSESSNEDAPYVKRKGQDRQLDALKADLRKMLSEPLIVRGVSTKYITSGSRPIVDGLLAGERESLLLFPDRFKGIVLNF